MIKQYVVEEAYSGNYSITKYHDGKEVGYVILAYWETEGYLRALEEEEYSRAYSVIKAKNELNETYENYMRAQLYYEEAKQHPLFGEEVE